MKSSFSMKTSMLAGVLCLLMCLAGSVNADLIAYWPFDTDLTDAAGTFDGTAVGFPQFVEDAPEGWGKALLLEGGGGVDCGNVISPTGSLDVSYAIWIKTTASTGTYGAILSKMENNPWGEDPQINPPYGYCLLPRGGNENNTFRGRMGAFQTYGGWGDELRSEENAYGDFWSHIIFTYSHETDTATFYINGELSGTMIGIQNRGIAGAANTVHNLFIGQGTPEAWSGMVDEVAVWDHTLTADEAMYVYLNGAGAFNGEPDPANDPEGLNPIIASNPLTLSWKNMPPVDSNSTTTVDVYFGTDPENFGDPIVSNEARNSVEVDASVPAKYYWRVDSHTGDPNTVVGELWSFTTVGDTAPVIDGITVDQMTWSGGPVPLSVDVTNEGSSATVYEWIADPAEGVEIIDGDTATPTVKITTVPLDPPAVQTVTMTVFVSDAANPTPVSGSMEIDVYETACAMARDGQGLDDPIDLNKDCKVDLGDLAIMAVSWLYDYSATMPADQQ